MNDRDQKILDAAIDVCSRYGVRKTTMGDIAAQAGISRPTLYARFSNKEEVMLAAMQLVSDRVVDEVTRAWQAAMTISERIDVFLECAIVRFFDQIKQMPDSSDLMAGYWQQGTGAQFAFEQGKIDLLVTLFGERREALAAKGCSPAQLAEFFYASSSSFKFTAHDGAHLESLLATLKRTTLVMLDEV
ncbi:TetR family transcriptional regulator [Hoeflea halophila]|uniref:TetR family transcriptional regulator n=1 Tax=Hoeflea halophila TaxID=714899 RepID=A0A286HU33_9HYPH|nr:TetR/AcrR family transcriptional regulator [Hoeflea halophila]SOE11292.1 TetR family transcriptional regulator [Hoeflea halophila]